ncbi:fatty acid desaturase [Streptomyces niveiscabiei]|uniref:fatty acid desaturase n=1 Tax=Streptomyces niveiscabiei TaxID=164115 RepID=UPI0029A19AC5|nr:fatty acid desaturase [Streptomyces niveiscabiei]MDX3382467.1 fatty acid desaturase [Streptomyces niveiscabiei]
MTYAQENAHLDRHNVFSSAELRELTRRSSGPALRRLSVHCLLYAAVVAGALAVDRWWAIGLSWALAGVVVASLHNLLHCASHGTFVRTHRGNRVAGQIAGTFILINSALYRVFHMHHHRNTHTAHDPEPDGVITTLREYGIAMLNVDYLVGFLRMSIASLWRRYPYFVKTERARSVIRRDTWILLLWIACATVLTVLWPMVMLTAYIMPACVGWVLNNFSIMPEHYYAERTDDPWRNTNSVYTGSRWFGFLNWNTNYHAEHHLYPGVPAWNLREVSERVRDRLAFTETSYIRFHVRLISDVISGRAKEQERAFVPQEGRATSFIYPLAKAE